MPRALVVDDDPSSLTAMAELVALEGFETSTAATLEEARQALAAGRPHVILCDLLLPDGKGTALLSELCECPGTELILVTGNGTVDTAVAALRDGAHDYLTKPVDVPRLRALLVKLRRTLELKQEVLSLRGELRTLGRFGPLVGTSPAMQKVYDLIEKVAPTAATVFLAGESGTGKEVVAETIHRLSKRRQEPFLALNCGAVAPNLMESELFGHEKGSFTGAERQHHGYLERASGGTLLLDEVTEMPLDLQVKLLRALETSRIHRVGGDRELSFDARIVAATNRDPEQAIAAGKLRHDLYYRLKVFPIDLPPLRDRPEDIPLLAQHFLDGLNRRERTTKRFARATVDQLVSSPWPGNVRELRNVVERAFILAEGEEIPPGAVPEAASLPLPPAGNGLAIPVGGSLADVERVVILATLHKVGGDKKRAAAILGVSLKTLYNRLKAYRQEASPEEAPSDAEPEPDAVEPPVLPHP